MNSRIARLVIGASVILAVAITVRGQSRPYDQIMKEVGPAYANLKKDLDASAFTAAAQDAAKLEGLFKETENFWAAFKTRDALDFAKNAQTSVEAVSVAARDNNGQKAQAAYNAIGKSCFTIGDEAAQQPTCRCGGLPSRVLGSATTSFLSPSSFPVI